MQSKPNIKYQGPAYVHLYYLIYQHYIIETFKRVTFILLMTCKERCLCYEDKLRRMIEK